MSLLRVRIITQIKISLDMIDISHIRYIDVIHYTQVCDWDTAHFSDRMQEDSVSPGEESPPSVLPQVGRGKGMIPCITCLYVLLCPFSISQ